MDINRMIHAHTRDWQRVSNERWPAKPRGFRDRPGIRVRARIMWERDGEEWLPGTAVRWNARHVFVLVQESRGRLRGQGVWLAPADVRRA
jgi:hypothetical protein